MGCPTHHACHDSFECIKGWYPFQNCIVIDSVKNKKRSDKLLFEGFHKYHHIMVDLDLEYYFNDLFSLGK